MASLEINYPDVNRAFTSQSTHFDADEQGNVVLADWRQKIYQHVEEFLLPKSSILELNAGTGTDAIHFTAAGHHVLATDMSGGMIQQLEEKAKGAVGLAVRELSFENLDLLSGYKFDYVFSNFGGLNCTQDLSGVAKHLPPLLHSLAYITFVVMPPVCPWEWFWVLKCKWKDAFRRLPSGGAKASIDGIHFNVFYHSQSQIARALGGSFKLVRAEGLGIFSPPPSAISFVRRYPRLARALQRLDGLVQRRAPFNRCGDHLILTYQYQP